MAKLLSEIKMPVAAPFRLPEGSLSLFSMITRPKALMLFTRDRRSLPAGSGPVLLQLQLP